MRGRTGQRWTNTTISAAATVASLSASIGLTATSLHAQEITPQTLLRIQQSLPIQEQTIEIDGLQDRVTIERDMLGVATITASTPFDAVFAQGFVHGQDRFFQMDLTRRDAGGSMAGLFGERALRRDQESRHYRLRHTAVRILAEATAEQQRLLDRYAAGVNAGLDALAAPPPEYVLIGTNPEPWAAVDSVLCMLALADGLEFGGSLELGWGAVADVLPPSVLEFLLDPNDHYTAPIYGENLPGQPIAIPGPQDIDLRSVESIAFDRTGVPGGEGQSESALTSAFLSQGDLHFDDAVFDEGFGVLGSNSWAVAGSRTKDGRAILAYDPHLSISLPGMWHRVSIIVGATAAHGVTAPGYPGVLLGNINGFAVGATTPFVDREDYIIIETIEGDATRYRTPDGTESFGEVVEVIEVLNGEPVELHLQTTRWGVVVDQDHRGRPLVRKWTATEPGMMTLEGLDMIIQPERLQTLEDFVAFARRWKGVSQNWLIASNEGRIAYVMHGAMPKRVGFDGRTPQSWADGTKYWDGQLDESLRPVVIDPPSGVLWTANNRTVDPATAREMVYWPFYADHRAWRIREMLRQRGTWDEAGLANMQLDVVDHMMMQFRDHALSALTNLDAAEVAAEERTRLEHIRVLLSEWNGTAAEDQRAYGLLRRFAFTLRGLYSRSMLASSGGDPRQSWLLRIRETVVLRLLDQRPEHWLIGSFDSWDAMLRSALLTAANAVESHEGSMDAPWGVQNRLQVAHILADEVPDYLKPALSLPEHEQHGSSGVVRVASAGFGASMRMVVSPGHLGDALFAMPGGQSGHPLSPNFRDHHDLWANGEYGPLLAGETFSTTTLTPAGATESRDTPTP